jgi:hypothetical protein
LAYIAITSGSEIRRNLRCPRGGIGGCGKAGDAGRDRGKAARKCRCLVV